MHTLEELNKKYPTCSTCLFQTTRPAGKNKPYWCSKHGRAVQHILREKEPVTDAPCEDYTYERR
jgi:hypothetical protein